MNPGERIRGIRASRSLPSDDDLERLRQMGMFLCVRVSCEAQVRERRESIRDKARTARKGEKDSRPDRRSGNIAEGGV